MSAFIGRNISELLVLTSDCAELFYFKIPPPGCSVWPVDRSTVVMATNPMIEAAERGDIHVSKKQTCIKDLHIN